MSIFKAILDKAYEIGYAGNCYSVAVENITNKYPTLVGLADFNPGTLICDSYESGKLDFEQESSIYLGESL